MEYEFVTAGICKKVQLKFWNSAKIETVRYDQKVLDEKQALLDIIITIDVQKAAQYQIYFGAKPYDFNLKKGINTVKIPVEFKNPKLWWSNGLGVPHQYVFQFQLQKNKVKLEEKELKIRLANHRINSTKRRNRNWICIQIKRKNGLYERSKLHST